MGNYTSKFPDGRLEELMHGPSKNKLASKVSILANTFSHIGSLRHGCPVPWQTCTLAVKGRIRLSVSTVNRTYELSGITHVTPFRKYGKHSTGPSTYGPWVRTYSKLFSCKSVLTVCSYRAQSNEICTYGRVSRGSLPRVRRYGLLYLRTVEYDQSRWQVTYNKEGTGN